MKFHKIILLLFLYVISTCSSTLLIEKAAYVANSVFKEFITSIVWWHDSSDDVTEFIKEYQGCIILTPMRDGNNDHIREFNKGLSYRQTVFFAANVDELEYFIALLNEDLVAPIHLIVVLMKPATQTALSELMETAWNNDVADILIVGSYAEDVLLTTYFPYSKGKCGDFTPINLDHKTQDFFPKKFANFHGCEIRASLLQMSPYSQLTFQNDTLTSISGIDGNVFNILFEVLNATMKIVSTTDHGGIGTMVNGTATGSFADLVNKYADIFCPAVMMSHLRYPYVQFSHAFESVNIHWFGPRRREISEWLRVIQPFMSNITPALFTSCILFVVITMAVHRFVLHRSHSRDSVLFQSFIVFLGQEVNFVTKSWMSNSLFMLWIWFCMVVRIAYQGDLVHGLQKTILESPLGNFETAVKVVDGYGGVDTFRDFYNETQYYHDYKAIRFSKLTDHLRAVEAGKRFLIMTDRLLALDSAPNIQALSPNPVSQLPVCFYMRPGWPAVAEIDNLLLRIIEAGFTQKVLREHFVEWRKQISKNENRGSKPLALETLIGCFYGLGVLYAVCVLVLIVEIFHFKIKHDYY